MFILVILIIYEVQHLPGNTVSVRPCEAMRHQSKLDRCILLRTATQSGNMNVMLKLESRSRTDITDICFTWCKRIAKRLKAALINRERAILPGLFIGLTMPVVLIQVFFTPPIQVADEDNHFLRATQIAQGRPFALRAEMVSGGAIDPAAVTFAHAFDALKFHPEVKISPATFHSALSLRWGQQPSIPTAFANTAIYPFFLYLPSSLALKLGKEADLGVMESFYFARLATGLVSLLLATAALWLCAQGQTTLFLILCFPMTLSLFASVSQDAMSIGLGALAVALWSRYAARRAPMPPWARANMALALGAVTAARLPLLPLCALVILPTRGHRLSTRDAAMAALGTLPLSLGIVGAYLAKVPFRPEQNVSPVGQLSWILHHPLAAVSVAIRTLWQDSGRHLSDMVGMLGWLDTKLPLDFYPVVGCCVVLAVLVDAAAELTDRVPRRTLLPIGLAFLTIGSVFGALYLAWTPIGADVVDGVQARYLLVPAMLLAVSLPSSLRVREVPPRILRAAQITLCTGVAGMNFWIVPITLLHRYYG